MDTTGFAQITSATELRELVGQPLPRVVEKVRPRLYDEHRTWLAASPFCLIATSGPDGGCDVSPKGDPPGFAKVLDATTLAIPDRPGNKRVDGFLNIIANPHVGLVFFIPGRGDTLRVNGRARLLREAPFFDHMEVRGHRPSIVLLVEVEEVFFHCAKAFLRSKLWEPETWKPDAAPSRARIAKVLERPDDSMEELERYYGEAYANGLY
jgi:PPOX class probable FMN-dependent enzyme